MTELATMSTVVLVVLQRPAKELWTKTMTACLRKVPLPS